MFIDARGNLYFPRIRRRKPKYAGQQLTEKYRRRAFFARRKGDLRILGTTVYERQPNGSWVKQNA